MGLFPRRKKQQQQQQNGAAQLQFLDQNGGSGSSYHSFGGGSVSQSQRSTSDIVASQRSMHASAFEQSLVEVNVACFPTEARIMAISKLYNELEVRRQPYHDVELIYHHGASIMYQKLSVCLSTNPTSDELSLIMATLDVLHISSEEALEQVYEDIGREALPLLVKVLFMPFTTVSSIQPGYAETGSTIKQQRTSNHGRTGAGAANGGVRELERSGRRASPPIKMAVEHACKILAAYSLLQGTSAVYDLCLVNDLLWGLTCIMDQYQGQNENARYAALATLTNISGQTKHVPEIALKLKQTPGVVNAILKMSHPEESITAQRHANQARANLGLSVHVHRQQPHYYTSSSGTDDYSTASGIQTNGASTFGANGTIPANYSSGGGTTSGGDTTTAGTGQSSSGATTEGGIYAYYTSGTSTSGASTTTGGTMSTTDTDGGVYGGGRAAARVAAAIAASSSSGSGSGSGGTTSGSGGGVSSGRSLSGYESSGSTTGEGAVTTTTNPFDTSSRTALETVNESTASEQQGGSSTGGGGAGGLFGASHRFQTIEQQEQTQVPNKGIQRSSMRWRGGTSVRLQPQPKQQQQPAALPNVPQVQKFRQSASVHRFGSSRKIGSVSSGGTSIGGGGAAGTTTGSIGDTGSAISGGYGYDGNSIGDGANSAIEDLMRNSATSAHYHHSSKNASSNPTMGSSTRKLGLGYRGGGAAATPSNNGSAATGGDAAPKRLTFSERYGRHTLNSSMHSSSSSIGVGRSGSAGYGADGGSSNADGGAVADLLSFSERSSSTKLGATNALLAPPVEPGTVE